MWSVLVSKKTLFLIGYNLYKLITSMLFGRHLKRCLFNLEGSLRGHEFLRILSEVKGTHLNARLTSLFLLSSRVLQRSTFTSNTLSLSTSQENDAQQAFSRAWHQ